MTYYFFRDIDNAQNSDYLGTEYERSFHAAGIVDELYNDHTTEIGKDVAVCYISPFTGFVKREWRRFDEVQLFEVDECDYEWMKTRIDKISAL